MKYPGTPLQEGSVGPEVKAVQKALAVQQTGRFGPTTEAAVVRFQTAHDLEPDGVVGPLTWSVLFGPKPARTQDVGERALEIARSLVGVTEKPLGSNRGPEVSDWLREAAVSPGNPWCAAFVHHCVAKACRELGVAKVIPMTASCSFLYRWAKANDRLTARPEVGDIFLCVGGDTGHFHTGFVAGPIRAGRFPTVEGNSNGEGSPDGHGVVKRSPGRRVESCHYVRL